MSDFRLSKVWVEGELVDAGPTEKGRKGLVELT